MLSGTEVEARELAEERDAGISMLFIFLVKRFCLWCSSSPLIDCWYHQYSLYSSESSKNFCKHLTSRSLFKKIVILVYLKLFASLLIYHDGIMPSPTLNFSPVTFLFLNTRLLDFISLIFPTMPSISFNVHFVCMIFIVLTDISSMNALTGGCLTPTFIHGPLLVFSDFIIKFIAAKNRISDIVQHVTSQTSRRCHDVVKS